MPAFKPTKRSDLIYYLRKIGFVGPESGGKHQYLLKGNLKLVIPNPHESDIGIALLSRLLKQVDVSRQEWENL